MALAIIDQGSRNDIRVDPAVAAEANATLLLSGNDNVVRIAAGVTMAGAQFTLGERSSLTIGADCRLAAIEIVTTTDTHVAIGAATNFTFHTRIYLHEPARVSIGARCLVASETLIMASDMHSIIDRGTGLRINPACDIVVEDDVWIGHNVTLLKGAHIGQGAIVGLGSVASRDVPAYTLAAGRPARVVKENVTWDPRLL